MSRVEETTVLLRELAARTPLGERLPPVRKLIQQFGASLSTLNAAMERLEREGLVERRHGSGVYVTGHRTGRRLALLVDPLLLVRTTDSPIWSRLISLADSTARERGATLQFHFLRPGKYSEDYEAPLDRTALHHGILEDVEQGRVDGILMLGIPHSIARWFQRQGVAVSAYAGPARYIVQIYAPQVAAVACRGLVGEGVWDLAIWHPFEPEPREPFLEAARQHGLTVLPDAPRLSESPDGTGLHSRDLNVRAYQATTEFLRTHPLPPAILSGDDAFSQGMLTALDRAGVRVGRDVQVVSYLNRGSGLLVPWERDIGRVEVDLEALVRLLFELIAAQIEDREPVLEPGCHAHPENDDVVIDLPVHWLAPGAM